MKRHGKKYLAAKKQVPEKPCTLEEAIPLLKKIGIAKFAETMEIAMLLGVDPKHADQMVRGTVVLPHGTGASKKVLVIATGDKQKEAQAAGADHVGGPELVAKIQEGWLDFDAVVATPDTMKDVGRLGKVLGPKGLMPSPKNGTVTDDVKTAVREFKAGKIEYRNDAAGNVQAAVGKLSFSEEDLRANVEAFIDHIKSVRPATVKGTFIEGVSISATMGPGIAVAVAE